MIQPIPEGYGTVTPYLIVDDVVGLVDFLEAAFDAEVHHLLKTDDGFVYNAEVQIGDSRIMMGQAREEYPARATDFYLYVPDCDAVYAQAVEAGADSIMEPSDMDYGDRNGGVGDPAGNRWWIATHIEDVSPEEALRRRQESDASS